MQSFVSPCRLEVGFVYAATVMVIIEERITRVQMRGREGGRK